MIVYVLTKDSSVFPKLTFRYFCFFLDAFSPYS